MGKDYESIEDNHGDKISGAYGELNSISIPQSTKRNGEFTIATFAKIRAQHELSTYYDTKDKSLGKKGVAVRMKRWFTYLPEAGSDVLTETGRILFIKVNIPYKGKLKAHQRREIRINIPKNANVELIPNLIEQAVKEILGIKLKNSLEEKVTLFNRRFFWDMYLTENTQAVESNHYDRNLSREVNLGFVTFDSFKEVKENKDGKYKLNPESLDSATAAHQYEIELTAEGQGFLSRNKLEIETIINTLLQEEGLKATLTPKAETFRQLAP